MGLIEREKLLAEYDRAHVGPPGGARKLIEEAPEVKPKVVAEIKFGYAFSWKIAFGIWILLTLIGGALKSNVTVMK